MEVDCSMVTGVDTFVVGLAKPGMNNMLEFKMLSATPAPPARGNNTWVVEVGIMQSGVVTGPLENATFDVVPFMPAHQHGTGVPVEITAMSTPGQYELSPVNLWMQGVWETTIRATAGTTSDTAMFEFCVD